MAQRPVPVDQLQREALQAVEALKAHGSKHAAAKALGWSYSTFARRVEAFKPVDFAQAAVPLPEPPVKPRVRVAAGSRFFDAVKDHLAHLKGEANWGGVQLASPTAAPGLDDNTLIISDLHMPYHHRDAFAFLKALQDKYRFTRIVNVGDETDQHAVSYHDHDPDLASAGHEWAMAREAAWELHAIFPEMDIAESNHGSLFYRKAKTNGIPRHLMVSYRDALFGERQKDGSFHRPGGRGDGWRWYEKVYLHPSRGAPVEIVHGKAKRTLTNVQHTGGYHFAQGHHHGTFELVHLGTAQMPLWGMSVGCLIDDRAYAFAYNKTGNARPVIGCGGLVGREPRLFRMPLDRQGRWTGEVP